MQDGGIHANLRYTQQAYVATVMKVTHAIFVQLSKNYLSAKNNFHRHELFQINQTKFKSDEN